MSQFLFKWIFRNTHCVTGIFTISILESILARGVTHFIQNLDYFLEIKKDKQIKKIVQSNQK